jgi:hypothetical protein
MTFENETRTVSGATEGLPGAKQASDLGFCAPPGTRTPNPLIVGLVCSSLLVAVRNCALTWAFAVRSCFVGATRSVTLPVESRPVSRSEPPAVSPTRNCKQPSNQLPLGQVALIPPAWLTAEVGRVSWAD